MNLFAVEPVLALDWVQIIVAIVSALAGYFARGRTPLPTPPNVPPVNPPIVPPAPGPQPQFPILELLLKLLAERFNIPLPRNDAEAQALAALQKNGAKLP